MIDEKEYKKRRDSLVKKLSKNSIAILFSADYKKRSNDTEYPYRQDSDFYYMCGFKEDKSALLFVKEKKKVKTILFVQKKDKLYELWNGKRLGVKKAKKRFLVDKVFSYDEIDKKMQDYSSKIKNIYYDISDVNDSIKKYSKDIDTHKNISKYVKKLRLIKSSAEIDIIKKALSITKDAHHNLMAMDKTDRFEYELQASLEYTFKKGGAYSDAYTSIVAGGNSANTLHYIDNDKKLKKDDLILIDAGCEYDYYASDITRTIPVSGKFTPAQKELYDMVLDVEIQIINMIKPEVLRSDLHKKSEELLTKGLVKYGILKGSVENLLKKQKHKKYFPHGIGHWMGVDVHDPCPYKYENGKEIPLKEGMVLTIEPGIYLDENDKNVPKKYRGIGIRIEDDILVTADGYENLSSDIVKTTQDIEALSKTI
jgi:Xaa-Pro aminopeptidase